MEKIIFYYFLAVIIPSIITLYNLGAIVYVIGEFKENVYRVPRILLILLAKISLLTILQLHSFHYIFHNYIPENFYYASIIINFYVIIEMYMTSKFSLSYLKYCENNKEEVLNLNKFKVFVNNISRKIFSKNIWLYITTEGFFMISGVLLVLAMVYNMEIFNFVMLIVYMLIFGIKQYLTMYLKTL